jgi:hypothetical protein
MVCLGLSNTSKTPFAKAKSKNSKALGLIKQDNDESKKIDYHRACDVGAHIDCIYSTAHVAHYPRLACLAKYSVVCIGSAHRTFRG